MKTMLKYKPLDKLEPSDFGFVSVYVFHNKMRINTITGLTEYNLEILSKKDSENAFKNGSTKLDWSEYQKNKKENIY